MTSHIIKIYVRVVRKIIIEYIETNSLISNYKHGFRKREKYVYSITVPF